MTVSHRVLGAAALCLAAVGAPASAQSIRFAGSTSGCFFYSDPCTPKSQDAVKGLRFRSGSFDATTVDGKYDFWGESNNFGVFGLLGDRSVYDGLNFLLDVSFVRPKVGGTDAIFSAALTGRVRPKPIGGDVDIDFSGDRRLNFTSPEGSGRFTLRLNDMTVTAGAGHTPITGSIDATVTPEPATMTLVATGLVALIPAARRRRKKD